MPSLNPYEKRISKKVEESVYWTVFDLLRKEHENFTRDQAIVFSERAAKEAGKRFKNWLVGK